MDIAILGIFFQSWSFTSVLSCPFSIDNILAGINWYFFLSAALQMLRKQPKDGGFSFLWSKKMFLFSSKIWCFWKYSIKTIAKYMGKPVTRRFKNKKRYSYTLNHPSIFYFSHGSQILYSLWIKLKSTAIFVWAFIQLGWYDVPYCCMLYCIRFFFFFF